MSPTAGTSAPIRGRARIALASLALLAGVLAALSQWAGGARASSVEARPNIVVITTDDQALSMLKGRYMPRTMNRIARHGTNLTDAVVTTPLCCPSRASLLTGQYAHNHGVLSNSYELLRDKDNVLPTWLREAGYRTVHVGKFLNKYEDSQADPAQVAPGWDVWFTILGATRYFDYDVSANGRRIHFGTGRGSHVTRVLSRKAVKLVRRLAPAGEPLYLQLDHFAPHTETGVNSGGRCGASAVPATARDEEGFRDEQLPTPPSFNEADVSDKPSYVRDRALLDNARIRGITRRYECAIAALRSVDRSVKKIARALRQVGELDNTVLVFSSDNGYYFGEHRIARDKTHPYEEGIRVPLLIRLPQSVLGERSPVPQVDEQVANIDLAPTFLQLAGAQPCGGDGECRVMDGRSLLPLLLGQGGWPWDRGLAIEYAGASSRGTSSCKYSGIRALGHLYVEHVQIPDPLTGICHESDEIEYYDMTRDPFQLQNLYPGYADPLMETLQERLALLDDCSGIAGRDPEPPAGSSYCE